MNISHDGTTVSFKTAPEELFEQEKSGAKPNTVRILDAYEADSIKHKLPTKIFIRHQQEIFLRTLTHIHFNYNVLGKVIVIFSWEHPKKHPNSDHVHVMPEPDEPDPLSHSMSLDDEPYSASLPGPHSVPFEQGVHNPGPQQVAESSINARFAAITISNGTLALLQSIAHGRTMDRVIKELYEAYIEKKSTERGPQHD